MSRRSIRRLALAFVVSGVALNGCKRGPTWPVEPWTAREPGDIVRAVNGNPVKTIAELQAQIFISTPTAGQP